MAAPSDAPSDSDRPIQLDYARRRSIWQTIEHLLLRRPLRAAEVFILGWLFVAVWWMAAPLLQQTRLIRRVSPDDGISIATAVLLVSMAAIVRLVVLRRWATLALCVAVALPSGFASGLVQFDRCPHATYLQFYGASFAIAGDRCRNPRDIRPWWMRR